MAQRRYSAAEWESRKEQIRQLYMVEGKSLKETMTCMETHHGFCAQERTYKRKLDMWRFQKNTKFSNFKAILAIAEQRRVSEGKNTRFRFRGHAIDLAKKILRYKSRTTMGVDEQASSHVAVDTYPPLRPLPEVSEDGEVSLDSNVWRDYSCPSTPSGVSYSTGSSGAQAPHSENDEESSLDTNASLDYSRSAISSSVLQGCTTPPPQEVPGGCGITFSPDAIPGISPTSHALSASNYPPTIAAPTDRLEGRRIYPYHSLRPPTPAVSGSGSWRLGGGNPWGLPPRMEVEGNATPHPLPRGLWGGGMSTLIPSLVPYSTVSPGAQVLHPEDNEVSYTNVCPDYSHPTTPSLLSYSTMSPGAQASHSENDEMSYTVASHNYSRPVTPSRVSYSTMPPWAQGTNPPYPEEGDDNGDMRETFGNKVQDELNAQELCQTNMGLWSQEMSFPAEQQYLQGQAFINAVPEVTYAPYITDSGFELIAGGPHGHTTSARRCFQCRQCSEQLTGGPRPLVPIQECAQGMGGIY